MYVTYLPVIGPGPGLRGIEREKVEDVVMDESNRGKRLVFVGMSKEKYGRYVVTDIVGWCRVRMELDQRHPKRNF